jgi:hypothetical protein
MLVILQTLCIDICQAAARYGHRIGVHQPGPLKRTLQFFTGRNSTFVSPVLSPDATLIVDIGLV